MKRFRTSSVAWVVFAALAVGAVPVVSRCLLPSAVAQNLGQRSVAGTVVDGASNPVNAATVFLRNQKTKAIRSYTSESDGRFHFAQVSMSEDYDLWAEKDGKKSAVKTVSSWDARKEFETELKIK